MRRVLFAVVVFAAGVTAGAAQNVSVIKERKDHLKQMGDAVKPVAAMFKGEADFELGKVQSALKIMQEKAEILPGLFPEDSKTGGDTEALPVIWEEKADVEARFKKLGESAKAAEAAITDEDTFLGTWKGVAGNCSGCHKKFRKPKS
ncbi:cytochrome c [Hyphomicrobium sp.]|uniref:c-type cytochrome n=1 Tax=Hyphomicrobium sp. TaxID=82 RepID=UPI0025C736A7|nr:cytochrome c [Hyphomicrobium sp.]MCC7253088.1 cytochrome c [Hyphomicrobium sp.]